MSNQSISRRALFRGGRDVGGLLGLSALLPKTMEAAAATDAAAATAPVSVAAANGKNVYESIGVRPLINARGTLTILSGSLMLPEVRAAMDAAARQHVHLDELADGIGARLAELTGAEWGIVSSGCAAGLTHATAACVAGGNPGLHIRIPDLRGFSKDEVIIPTHSRNVYDAAIRAVGVRVIEVDTPEALDAAIGPRTAMIYIMAGPRVDESPLDTKTIAAIAQPRGVPILVDAAAEILTVPNVHLENGATLVGYSGGKCLRGPQSAGLILGRKDLCKAAWVHSAPHHGFARGMKVGKEDAIGMLVAVEMWVTRDHDAEWAQWTEWLEQIAGRVSEIDGVTTSVVSPDGLSNRTPSLEVLWDESRVGLSGSDAAERLFDEEPRIALSATRGDNASQTGLRVTPYMFSPGDAEIVADRLHAVLSNPPGTGRAAAAGPAADATDLSGRWEVRITYAATSGTDVWHLRQHGNDLEGMHQGELVSRDISGTIDGETIRIRSSNRDAHDRLAFTFSGTVVRKEDENRMEGTLDMGEYLEATWTAARHGDRAAEGRS